MTHSPSFFLRFVSVAGPTSDVLRVTSSALHNSGVGGGYDGGGPDERVLRTLVVPFTFQGSVSRPACRSWSDVGGRRPVQSVQINTFSFNPVSPD